MFDIETLKVLKELGYGLASLIFCFWLMRELVLKMGKSLDMLVVAIQSLQSRIEFWNKDTEIAHSAQRIENKDMSERISELKLK